MTTLLMSSPSLHPQILDLPSSSHFLIKPQLLTHR